MRERRLISLAVLLSVLMVPMLSLAVCAAPMTNGHARCACCPAMSGSARTRSMAGTMPRSSAPQAPCCQRRTPLRVVSEPAVTAAPTVQLVPVATVATQAAPIVLSAPRQESVAASPPSAPTLSLLCTLLI